MKKFVIRFGNNTTTEVFGNTFSVISGGWFNIFRGEDLVFMANMGHIINITIDDVSHDLKGC